MGFCGIALQHNLEAIWSWRYLLDGYALRRLAQQEFELVRVGGYGGAEAYDAPSMSATGEATCVPPERPTSSLPKASWRSAWRRSRGPTAGSRRSATLRLLCATPGGPLRCGPGPTPPDLTLTSGKARLGLGRYFGYYNHLRRHRSLDRRTPARRGGAEPGAGEKLLVRPARRHRIETGDGRSVAARAAVAPVALRAPSATAAGTLPMAAVPPYSRLETVQRMGTS